MVWCGARKGRWRISGTSPGNMPATEYMRVTSSASVGVMRGRIEGSERASSVLPDPGGPANKMLWPPAAATSKARLVCS